MVCFGYTGTRIATKFGEASLAFIQTASECLLVCEVVTYIFILVYVQKNSMAFTSLSPI
jgi:hypothetical protein